MQLKTAYSRLHLFHEGALFTVIALTGEPNVYWQVIISLEHLTYERSAWRASCCVRASTGGGQFGAPWDLAFNEPRACTATEKGGDSRTDGFVRLLRTDVVNVRIKCPSSNDVVLAGDDVCA